MRYTEAPRPRRWWASWTDALAWRWEADVAFRHSFSLLVTAVILALMAICLFTAMMVVHQIAPQWFGEAPGGVNPGVSLGGNATFPIAPLHPLATPPNEAPIAIATSTYGPLSQPTPTPAISTPTPLATATTVVASNHPTCPPLTGQPALDGRSVLDGTLPDPLQGGCPAQLIIRAASHPNAPIIVALTFGNLDPIGCTANLNGTTDGSGAATLSFTVPGGHCFHGSILTSGTIIVGGDISANVGFFAQA